MKRVTGEFVEIDGKEFYKISNYKLKIIFDYHILTPFLESTTRYHIKKAMSTLLC